MILSWEPPQEINLRAATSDNTVHTNGRAQEAKANQETLLFLPFCPDRHLRSPVGDHRNL